MTRAARRSQAGMTMLEVLITLVILAFGLLGLAGLHIKIQTLDMEAYQRAQGILLLRDMVERMKANSANAASYLSTAASPPPVTYPYGTDDPATDTLQDCADAATFDTEAKRGVCEWSNALKGAAESSSGTKVGAMIGGRGCIEQLQAEDASAGVCKPGIYRVTVAWQGLYATTAPSLSCGKDLYGDPVNDALRRAISSDIVVGLASCI